jgi:hypothetical protein
MMKIMARSSILGFSLALVFSSAATLAVAAPNGAAEIFTATNHANLAAQATDITMVHQHLHHVVNCLVGPGGPGFDANELNPCAGGNGAIKDAAGASPAQKKSMQQALIQAMMGISQINFAKAQKSALNVANSLKAVRSH